MIGGYSNGRAVLNTLLHGILFVGVLNLAGFEVAVLVALADVASDVVEVSHVLEEGGGS